MGQELSLPSRPLGQTGLDVTSLCMGCSSLGNMPETLGENILLDGVISISVLAVEGTRVKIGITAPPHVTIIRDELLKNAASLAPDLSSSPTPHE